MPNKNTVKVFVSDSYYHIYNRGWNLGKIFFEEADYLYFELLLARHLSPEAVQDNKGREYKFFYDQAHLVAYCLMGNHFHMLVYQNDEHAITKIMTSISTAYTMYFNRKYSRRGALFESTYKAVRIESDMQLMHITRYIHLNHASFRTWTHSSYSDHVGKSRKWIDPSGILELFSSLEQYITFVDDYKQMQRERDDLKKELAAG